MAKDIGNYLEQVVLLRREADELPEDNPGALIRKIRLLKNCFMYIGRISSTMDGDYKRIYAQRHYEHAVAYKNAAKNKQAEAEIAVKELRQKEADAYESMNRWRNALNATQEEIHFLKLVLKVDFEQGE
jgi:hypothetical protein